MSRLIDQPDKRKHFSASLAAMLVLGGIVLTLSGSSSPVGIFAVFAAVVGVGLAKERLWDPWLRPKLGLGEKGAPDMDDMKANIAGAAVGLLGLALAGLTMAAQGG